MIEFSRLTATSLKMVKLAVFLFFGPFSHQKPNKNLIKKDRSFKAFQPCLRSKPNKSGYPLQKVEK